MTDEAVIAHCFLLRNMEEYETLKPEIEVLNAKAGEHLFRIHKG